jgi:hypothetical protein
MTDMTDSQLLSMINEFQQLLSTKINELKVLRPELIEMKRDQELSQEITILTGVVNHLVKYKTFKTKMEMKRQN